MKHPTKVERYSGTLEELARDIVNMRYDSVAKFLEYFSEKLIHDSVKDYHRNRKQLSKKLELTAIKTYEARELMDSIWKVCKKYMK